MRGTLRIDAQTGAKRADGARNIADQVVEPAGADLLFGIVGIGVGPSSE